MDFLKVCGSGKRNDGRRHVRYLQDRTAGEAIQHRRSLEADGKSNRPLVCAANQPFRPAHRSCEIPGAHALDYERGVGRIHSATIAGEKCEQLTFALPSLSRTFTASQAKHQGKSKWARIDLCSAEGRST